MISVFLLLTVIVSYVETIGENPMDINALAGIIGGISNMMQNNVETIDVPSSQIMGQWYQVYKAAISFDAYKTDMFCPVAYFKPNSVMGEDGFSIEEAYRVITKNGPVETFKRDLNKVGTGQYWMYTEEYFYPRQCEWKEKENLYEYMIVTDANRLSLSVYARHPMIFYQKYNEEVVKFLEHAGFGGRVFGIHLDLFIKAPIVNGHPKRSICSTFFCGSNGNFIAFVNFYQWAKKQRLTSFFVFENKLLSESLTESSINLRVLKNQEAARNTGLETATKSGLFGSSLTTDAYNPIKEMLQNPQLALQKLVQGH
ncbi:Condensin complex subunit 3 [Dirofilaria immitis]|nr:Condensin complex subunit 3 [Dirofilaria immitis]